jgi:inosose dehydratase
MPTDPAALQAELERRRLVMLGAFVPIALKDRPAHDASIRNAVKTARLLAAVASSPQPFLVLADENGTVPERTLNAGRITPEMGLSLDQWKVFAEGAAAVGRAVLDVTGLQTVFHHHCAGYVETPEEIAMLLELTDPELLGLVFDTGHYAYGSGGACVVEGLERFKDRIRYMHFKDCHPGIAAEARSRGWDYFEALRRGLFCELGQGSVDFPGVLRWLKSSGYTGYTLVEQDILPGMGTPRESARRNREYLRSIESNYA